MVRPPPGRGPQPPPRLWWPRSLTFPYRGKNATVCGALALWPGSVRRGLSAAAAGSGGQAPSSRAALRGRQRLARGRGRQDGAGSERSPSQERSPGLDFSQQRQKLRDALRARLCALSALRTWRAHLSRRAPRYRPAGLWSLIPPQLKVICEPSSSHSVSPRVGDRGRRTALFSLVIFTSSDRFQSKKESEFAMLDTKQTFGKSLWSAVVASFLCEDLSAERPNPGRHCPPSRSSSCGASTASLVPAGHVWSR